MPEPKNPRTARRAGTAKPAAAKKSSAATRTRATAQDQPAPSADWSATSSEESYESLGAVAEDAGALIGSYLKDVATTCTTSLSSIQAGTYKVEDVWDDGIKMWSTYMTGMTKALELGARAAKAYASKPGDVS